MPSCKKEHRSGNINNFVCFLISKLTFHAIATLPGMTLHQAILEEDINKIIHLLDSGHSADSLDKEGWSPLMLAAASEQMDVFELLLDHGARDQHVEPVTKQSVLMQVASSGHLKIVERLLKVGANPNLWDRDHTTALQFASASGKVEVISLLLDHGALIDHQDRSRRTALTLAVVNGHRSCAERLLERGAWVDPPNLEGLTPLMFAVKKQNREMVKLLLKFGARTRKKDSFGKTAITWANEIGNLDLFNLMLLNV